MYKIVINMKNGNKHVLVGLFDTYQGTEEYIRQIEKNDIISIFEKRFLKVRTLSRDNTTALIDLDEISSMEITTKMIR